MRLVLLFGPQAVGKMTVGQELAKMTGLKLFHNHMTIDLVLNFFEYGTPPFKRLVNSFRNEILTEVCHFERYFAHILNTILHEMKYKNLSSCKR